MKEVHWKKKKKSSEETKIPHDDDLGINGFGAKKLH
jgi:hypothetical protein